VCSDVILLIRAVFSLSLQELHTLFTPSVTIRIFKMQSDLEEFDTIQPLNIHVVQFMASAQ